MTVELSRQASFPAQVRAELAAIEAMLVAKNEAYGNSALEPVRIFSRADPVEQIMVRIDDKLSRLQRGHATGAIAAEDVVLDLIGYLVLLRIASASAPNACGHLQVTKKSEH